MPSANTEKPGVTNVRIKGFDGRYAAKGVWLDYRDKKCRKLEIGEIVPIADDYMIPDRFGGEIRLIDQLLNPTTGESKVEVTTDPATRPFSFSSTKLAQLTSPAFQSTDPGQIEEHERILSELKAAMS